MSKNLIEDASPKKSNDEEYNRLQKKKKDINENKIKLVIKSDLVVNINLGFVTSINLL